MTTVTVSEARATLPALLDAIKSGKTVTITRHGIAAATLAPPSTTAIQITERDWNSFIAALDAPDTPVQAALRAHRPNWGVKR